jgi:hypothetical protein
MAEPTTPVAFLEPPLFETPAVDPPPTAAADPAKPLLIAEPGGAVIEMVERHTGAKYPYVGAESIVRPNHLRINGIAVWATYDNPAVIEEISLDGSSRAPLVVTVQLLARALKVGGTPAFTAGALGGPDSNIGAIVEIPTTDALDLEPNTYLERPYVLLNGEPLFISGSVRIGQLSTGGNDRDAATVTLPLLCRRLVVDDEAIVQATP